MPKPGGKERDTPAQKRLVSVTTVKEKEGLPLASNPGVHRKSSTNNRRPLGTEKKEQGASFRVGQQAVVGEELEEGSCVASP